MKVTINYSELNLQEDDNVELREHECGRCGCPHIEVTVTRAGIRVAHFGEYVRLVLKEPEEYGDVKV